MKLKKLEICGFKSFPHKSAIHFPAGISAVVGPNGCGKSNIADALRWVMGEQSVKQLRGKSMEDVIFSGANGTASTNLAEVSLTLINDNGSAPAELREYSEIMLTRRLYRSGESAYLLNRRPCRLKDIQNIFLGSGLGPKSYAIIQQGNVGAIIEAGPEGLRYFLEEAAGVTRYKSRREEALRKVNQTDQNLLRLQDILSEIERQMKGLKRQAKRAEKYRKYQKKIRRLEIRLALTTYDGLAEAGAAGQANLQRLQDRHQAETAQLRKIEAALESIKARRWEKNEALDALRSRQHTDQRRADGMEHDLKHARESVEELKTEIHELQRAKRDLNAKNLGLAEEIVQVEQEIQSLEAQTRKARQAIDQERAASQGLRQQAAELQKRLEQKKRSLMEMVAQEARIANIHQSASENRDQLKRRLKQTDESVSLAAQQVAELEVLKQTAADELAAVDFELEDLNGLCGRLRRELTSQAEALGAQVKAVQNLELEYSKTDSRLSALKKMAANYEGYREGVKALMRQVKHQREGRDPEKDNFPSSAIKGVVGDILAPAPGYETATETALGDALQYVMVEDQAAASEAMAYLNREQAGRCGFIPLNAVKPLAPEESASHRQPPDPETPRLLDYVQVQAPFAAVAGCLLGHVTLADDLAQALALHNRNGSYQSVVTPRGDLVSPQGIMLGGSGTNGDGILAKKNQLRALAQTCTALKRQLDSAHSTQSELEHRVQALETDLQETLEQREELRLRRTETEKEAYRRDEEHKHARSHLEIVELEREQLQGEELEFAAQVEKYRQRLAEARQHVSGLEGEVTQTSSRIEANTAQMEAFNQRLVQMQLDQTAVSTRLETQRSTLQRLQTFYDDGAGRFRALSEEIERKTERLAAAREAIATLSAQIKTAYADLDHLSDELSATEKAYQEIDGQLKESDQESAELRRQREETQEAMGRLELEQAQRRMQQEEIARRMQEQYQVSLAQIRHEIQSNERQLQRDSSVSSPADPPESVSDTTEMQAELEQLRERLARMPDVNLGAISEYEMLNTRHDFLTTQKEDLENAIADLHKVIRKINRITQERFLATLAAVNQKLDIIFPKLFTGGTAQLVLTEPGNPLETGVEFMIHPPGKKLTRMSLLSGGEKALSAIAFIFAIFLIKPASFCLMDEIDAPLDDANIQRFNELLKVIGQESQIIMITHNKQSMEFADTLFGVTMEKKGISKIVSVNLEKPVPAAA